MKELTRGRIAEIDGDFDPHNIETTAGQHRLDGSPAAAFDVHECGELFDGREFIAGLVAHRIEENEQQPDVSSSGEITIQPEQTTVEMFGRFAAIPGELLIYEDGFVIDHFRANTPTLSVDEVGINVRGWADDNSLLTAGTVGFQGRPSKGSKGTIYGTTNVLKDDDLGDDMRQTPLNQLRGTFDTSRFSVAKVYLCQSGYIDVHDGVDTTAEFLQFVVDEVAPYAVGRDESESGEDEAQSEPEPARKDTNDTQAGLDDLDTVNVSEGGE
jgi:hypothetical protein